MTTPIRCGDGDILHYCGCGPLLVDWELYMDRLVAENAQLRDDLAGAKRLNTDLLAALPVEDAGKPVPANGPKREFVGYTDRAPGSPRVPRLIPLPPVDDDNRCTGCGTLAKRDGSCKCRVTTSA